jgi:hypothetical protein
MRAIDFIDLAKAYCKTVLKFVKGNNGMLILEDRTDVTILNI